MEEKTYPVMDSPVYKEAEDANFILIEGWICKLYDCLFKCLKIFSLMVTVQID